MRELIPQLEEKPCYITNLPTAYLYNGTPIHESFLTAANKFCAQYPDKTFDEAMEIIVSALIYKKNYGEENMEPEKIKEILTNTESIWISKIKKLFKK